MTRRRADRDTIDLFAGLPAEPVVPRFRDDQVRAGDLCGRISRAVRQTLEDTATARDEVADGMSRFLSARITRSMLDAYASQAKEGHSISLARMIALIAVTGDARALNAALADVGLVAVPAKFEALIRRERAKELRDEIDREIQAAEAEWRARR